MPSDTDICNSAISKLGGNQIMDITDESPEAQLCRANYDLVRDAVLEDVNWTFATKRFVFTAANLDAPLFGFTKAYTIPAEVLRVIDINDGRDDWVKEGEEILTDAGKINMIAIIRERDPEKYSPSFVQCMAAKLASEIALPLTNSKTQRDAMVEEYLAKKNWAQSNDGRQGRNKVRYSKPFRR